MANAGEPVAVPVDDGKATRVIDPVDKYSALIVRGTIVGAGLFGVALFLRNSRIFAKFQNAAQIPKEFIRKELELKGTIREVLPSGALRVEHAPIVRLPRLWPRKLTDKPGLLTVRLAGVDISKAGLSYITRDLRLSNKPITFTVIKHAEGERDTIDCDVTYKKSMLKQTNLNVDLVRRGYARVPSMEVQPHVKALQSVPAYSRLIQRLLMSEKVADRRGVGVWERDTWVEQVQSYPSAVTQMIKAAPITRFVVLLFNVTRDVIVFGIHVVRNAYQVLLTACAMAAQGYRSFATGVDRMTAVYGRVKRRLTNK